MALTAPRALKLRYNSVMARGDAVIANSHFTADTITKLYPFARERLRVIHRGTDLRMFSSGAVDPARVTALRSAWGVAPHERIVLLAARLTGWKGQRVLIEAAAKLKLEGVRYILAGDAQGRDGYVKELDRLIDARGTQRRGQPGRPLRRHAGGVPNGFRGRRALDRAGGVRA